MDSMEKTLLSLSLANHTQSLERSFAFPACHFCMLYIFTLLPVLWCFPISIDQQSVCKNTQRMIWSQWNVSPFEPVPISGDFISPLNLYTLVDSFPKSSRLMFMSLLSRYKSCERIMIVKREISKLLLYFPQNECLAQPGYFQCLS